MAAYFMLKVELRDNESVGEWYELAAIDWIREHIDFCQPELMAKERPDLLLYLAASDQELRAALGEWVQTATEALERSLVELQWLAIEDDRLEVLRYCEIRPWLNPNDPEGFPGDIEALLEDPRLALKRA